MACGSAGLRCIVVLLAVVASASSFAAGIVSPVHFKLEFGHHDPDLPSGLDLASGLRLQATLQGFDYALKRHLGSEDFGDYLQMVGVGTLMDRLPLVGERLLPFRLGLNLGVMLQDAPHVHSFDSDSNNNEFWNYRYYPAATVSLSWKF